jgi:hypothetical protein
MPRDEMPWDKMAASEVRGLRGAITAQMSEKPVSSDVAPMMSELLARLDSFVEGQPRTDVAAPRPQNLAEPPTLRETAAALGRAGSKIRNLSRDGADPQKQAALSDMIRVLDHHLAMRHEIVMRSQL